MKKLKMLLCVAVLSTLLGTNALATDFVTVGTTSILTSIVTALFGSGGNCPVRQCGDCRPINEGGGECRPPAE
jgi:hypothetical protein